MSDKKLSQEELNYLVDEHEKWFADNSTGERLVLTDKNLQGINLSGRRLNDSIIKNVDFSKSNFAETKMYRVEIENVSFAFSNLRKSELTDSNLENVDFTGANLEEAEMMGFVIAKNLKFDNANLVKAKFIKSSLNFASFRNTSLRQTNFHRVYINESLFEKCDLREAILTYALIVDCEVNENNLEGANIEDFRELPEEWKQKLGWTPNE